MCEYCDLYDHHKDNLFKAISVLDDAGISMDNQIILFIYVAAYLIGGHSNDPEVVYPIVEQIYQAGLRRGILRREYEQAEESKEKQRPN